MYGLLNRTIARCSALVTEPSRAFSSLGNASFAVEPGAPKAGKPQRSKHFGPWMLQTVRNMSVALACARRGMGSRRRQC